MGEGAQRIGRTRALRRGDCLHRSIAGRRQLGFLRQPALRELGGCLVDSALDVFDCRGQCGDCFADIAGCTVNGIQHRIRLLQSRFPATHTVNELAHLARDGLGRQCAALADRLVGEGDTLLGGIHIARHRRQCRLGELAVQCGQFLLRRFQPRGHGDQLSREGVEALGCVEHQITHLVKGRGLGVQFPVGLGRRNHHPGQQVATFGLWFGNIVVELLAHGEGLFERRSGMVHGSGEWRSLGLPEFLDRQDQLVGAGAHRVIHLNDDRARQVVKGVNRHRCQRGGIGRVDILGGRDIGGVALGPSAAAPYHQRRDHQQSDTDDDQHWYQ